LYFHHFFLVAQSVLFSFLIPTSILNAKNVTLKVNGSTTVNPVVADGAEYFRRAGWKVYVDTHGGSSGGITSSATKKADIGMASRYLNAKDHKKFPKASFKSFTIGYDGVALVANKDVFENGITALTKEQIKDIYEGKITNWKKLGGKKDFKIRFYNKEPGRGTWEVFKKFVYGKEKAPKVFHPEVGANQEALAKVASTPGAVTQLSAAWAYANPKTVAPLSVFQAGVAVPPTEENIANSRYPLKRPLNLIISGKMTPTSEQFIRYFLTPEGQKLVAKHGYLPLPDNVLQKTLTSLEKSSE